MRATTLQRAGHLDRIFVPPGIFLSHQPTAYPAFAKFVRVLPLPKMDLARIGVLFRPMRGLIGLLLFVSSLVHAGELSGIVSRVVDGDTLHLQTESGNVEVRLVDIDAPESRQPGGKESTESLRSMCFQQQATVEDRGFERYGRTLGVVRCSGVDVNAEQVRRGMAWVFKRYVRNRSPLYQVEEEARVSRRGLWNDPAAVPPWEWRANRRVKATGVSAD